MDRRCLSAIRGVKRCAHCGKSVRKREREREIRGGESQGGKEPVCDCEIVGWNTRVNCSSSPHCAEW